MNIKDLEIKLNKELKSSHEFTENLEKSMFENNGLYKDASIWLTYQKAIVTRDMLRWFIILLKKCIKCNRCDHS